METILEVIFGYEKLNEIGKNCADILKSASELSRKGGAGYCNKTNIVLADLLTNVGLLKKTEDHFYLITKEGREIYKRVQEKFKKK